MNRRNEQDLRDIIVALVPLVVLILIQRPDVRRMLQMRASLFVKRIADSQANMWEEVATKAAQSYQNARI